jgi:peptidoglycan/xylan/chitin deacetylase (PgdA/CDA1 family)
VRAHHGFPATVFVVADHVGGDNAWGGVAAGGIPTVPLMTWDALGHLAVQGFEIGAHTRRHPDLRLVRGAALEDEIAGCVESIAARLGVRPSSFAYPFGRFSGPTLVAVRDVYERAVTTELRTLGTSEDQALLPRLDMYYFRGRGQLEAWGSAAFRRRLWLRAHGRRVREMMQTATGTHAA